MLNKLPFMRGLATASLFTLPLMAFISPCSAAERFSDRDAVEFTPREGLPNFFNKLDKGEDVTVVYFGGSITAQNGWRVQSAEWLQKEYPDAKIEPVSAAIGGTGSDVGVFRAENDALSHHPDLLFVEFAVNDASKRRDSVIKAMEGIVRKTWEANPETDICFVYTVTKYDSKVLADGKVKTSTAAMEEVADYYGIPSIHFGMNVAKLEKEGKLVMETKAPMTQVSGDELNEAAELATDEQGRIIFSKDGVHPYPETGHVLYTQVLTRCLEDMSGDAGVLTHSLQDKPLDPQNWEQAQRLPITDNELSGPYVDLTAQGDAMAKRFAPRLSPLYRLAPGAELHFKFKGTKVMIYDVIGPRGATLEITLDGKSRKKVRMDGYCTYDRLSILSIGDNLKNEVHEVSIRVLDEPLDKRNILFERNRDKYDANPALYADSFWYPGAIFIVGEMVP
ncbi:MAG: SGNH/GDSL hydrolase family protein [Puniceicoccales bacterium]